MSASILATILLFQTGITQPEDITWNPSPHYSSRPAGQTIDAIVIHTTEGSFTSGGVVSWFQNPNSKVSSHYILDHDGAIIQMVADDKKAWHATYYNSRSIGIDFCGKASDPDTFTDPNMDALIDQVAWLCYKYDIPAVHPTGDAYDYPDDNLDEPGFVAHGQVQPWNRSDPGPHFDWDGFLSAVQAKLAAAYALTAPTGLSASVETSGISFTWDPVPSAALYQLDIAETGEELDSMTGSFQTLYVGEGTAFTWSAGDTAIPYSWSITAQNDYSSASSTAAMLSQAPSPDSSNCSAILPRNPARGLAAVLGLLLLLGTFALRGARSLQ